MYVPFEELTPSARVWIYQFDREINENEKGTISNGIQSFCKQWQAHGAPLKTSFRIEYDHFLILAVDENVASASGCSIDGSVRVLKEIGSHLNLDFFNRTLGSFLVNDKVVVYPIAKLKQLFSDGILNTSVYTFNNLIGSKAELGESWKIPVSQSWLAKYLPKSALA